MKNKDKVKFEWTCDYCKKKHKWVWDILEFPVLSVVEPFAISMMCENKKCLQKTEYFLYAGGIVMHNKLACNNPCVLIPDFNIVDWFDPYNIDHLYAYLNFHDSGEWPTNFIPAGLHIQKDFYKLISEKLAKAYCNHMIESQKCLSN